MAGPASLWHCLLRVQTMYKVLAANCLVVLLGAVLGTWLTGAAVRSSPAESHLGLLAALAAVGALLSLAVNYFILRAAFSPLLSLVETAEKVRHGKLDARAPAGAISDPRIERLRDTLNAMLDTLGSHRRQLQGLSSQVLAAQEEERKRISRELHDETAQALTSLLVRLRVVEGARTPDEVRRQTAELRELTVSILEEVRKLAVELRPTTLDHLGLVAALEGFTREHAQRLEMPIAFTAVGALGRLRPEVELVLYRVVQEAVTNIARHADATRARVAIRADDGRVTAEIEDDGRGFDAAAIKRARAAGDGHVGLGLFGMEERVALLGGSIRIDSRPGGGTRVSVDVPADAWVLGDVLEGAQA